MLKFLFAMFFIAAGFLWGAGVAHVFGLPDHWQIIGAACAVPMAVMIGRELWFWRDWD